MQRLVGDVETPAIPAEDTDKQEQGTEVGRVELNMPTSSFGPQDEPEQPSEQQQEESYSPPAPEPSSEPHDTAEPQARFAEEHAEVATVPAGALDGAEGEIEEDTEVVDEDGNESVVPAGTRVVEEDKADDQPSPGLPFLDQEQEEEPSEDAEDEELSEDEPASEPDAFSDPDVLARIKELNSDDIFQRGEEVKITLGEQSLHGTVAGHNVSNGLVSYHVSIRTAAADFISGTKEKTLEIPVPAEYVSK